MSRKLLMKIAVSLAAFVLLASACSSDDEGDDESSTTSSVAEVTSTVGESEDDSTATTEGGDDEGDTTSTAASEDGGDEELTASAPGVSEDTITVGISMLDFPGLISANLSASGWGDQELIWNALVQDLNDRGGINGRMVEAELQYYNPTVEAEVDAACLRFTQDIEAFAVLGGFLGPFEASNTCIAADPDTALVMGTTITNERLEQAQAPWIISGASSDRGLETFIALLDETGELEGKKIAVVGGIDALESYEQALVLLDDYGIEPVLEIENNAQDGDIPAGDAEWAVIAQQILANDADTVLLIGNVSTGVRGIGDNALDVAIWTPNAGRVANLGESVPPEYAEGILSQTGLTDAEIFDDDLSQECIERFNAIEPDIEVLPPDEVPEGEEEWHLGVLNYCRWLALFELVMTDAGANPTMESFAEAVANAGEFVLPGIPFASLAADKPDANDGLRLSAYNTQLGESGDWDPVSDLVDTTP